MICHVSPLCLGTGGEYGWFPVTENLDDYLPVRSPVLQRTSSSATTVPYEQNLLAEPYYFPFVEAEQLAPAQCACIWPALVSWCLVCNQNTL